jgi:hypothetical protein
MSGSCHSRRELGHFVRIRGKGHDRKRPKGKLVTIENAAHAPALMCDEQIRIVADFLAS